MDTQQIGYSVSGQVAHITLNAPERLNAIGPQMASELVAALEQAAGDEAVRVVLLSGAGKAFCAGGDIGAFAEQLAAGHVDMSGLIADLARAAVLIRSMPKAVVASVHRAAAGAGMGLALLADFCIVADDTTFTTAFAGIGLASDTGLGYVLTRRLGHIRANQLMVGGRTLGAGDALAFGLVTEVVAADELSQATIDVIGGLLTAPQRSFAAIKEQIWVADYSGFEEYLAREGELQEQCGAHPDFAEGVQAFRERRSAHYA